MPKVTISSSKGLEQTSGSGFSVSDVELVRSNESITPVSASYTITVGAAQVAVDDTYGGQYFNLEDAAGTELEFWFDTNASGSAPSGVTSSTAQVIDIDLTGTTSIADICTAIAVAINSGSIAINSDGDNMSDYLFAVAGATSVSVYVLETGEMTNSVPFAADNAGSLAVELASDGSSGDLDADVECSLISVGNEVSTLNTTAALADGSSVGQKKNIIFASAANGEVNVGGALSSAGSSAVLLSLSNPGASAAGAACLVWNGSAWVVTNTSNVAVS
jgi:hypothetical protein